ncbi:MAG: chemotaxis protein CheD [Eubacterium sp.]|nr:chemotaxis protein CheD [Eubacterium sp.]
MKDSITVGLSDFKICKSPQKIVTIGLGSCVGVIIYDKSTKTCGMAHVMMPDSTKFPQENNKLKFADICLSRMIESLLESGVHKIELIAKIAGGACMFGESHDNPLIDIGAQNVEAVRTFLENNRIPIVAEDVGGDYGRTLEFDPSNGELRIRTAMGEQSII